ncbi:MAG: hypothetical protein CM1200mP10_28640 [Candidatus Neomarinimicrobiota bacterium]|nr:MAG: hypothetical protein CM1200mP10_28640 [Candidatus Neomarinimicrobiota bacterium]
MAPPHAKAYLMALTDNIKKFESKYGEIKSPGQEGFTDYGVNLQKIRCQTDLYSWKILTIPYPGTAPF